MGTSTLVSTTVSEERTYILPTICKCTYTYIYISAALPCSTLQYIPMLHITLQDMPLHCIALHCIPIHYITLHCIRSASSAPFGLQKPGGNQPCAGAVLGKQLGSARGTADCNVSRPSLDAQHFVLSVC